MAETSDDPTEARDIAMLRLAHGVAERSLAQGNHPFGALLAGPAGEVLMEQGNIETEERGTGHAEAALARRAVRRFDPARLWQCTLYTTVEPCVMCAGCVYWANIGRVVYGVPEAALLALTGSHADNPTMSLQCREVFRHGQKPIAVAGPFPALTELLLSVHEGYWR